MKIYDIKNLKGVQQPQLGQFLEIQSLRNMFTHTHTHTHRSPID